MRGCKCLLRGRVVYHGTVEVVNAVNVGCISEHEKNNIGYEFKSTNPLDEFMYTTFLSHLFSSLYY